MDCARANTERASDQAEQALELHTQDFVDSLANAQAIYALSPDLLA
jgi:hypothetical protein